MTYSPFEQGRDLQIGTVEFASPDEIKVVLNIESPESVALNAGSPRAFPRVNGYLLVSVDDGLLVGQVEWVRIERSPFPKRRGMKDFGLVDLPFPLRTLRLNPLGTLKAGHSSLKVRFTRGSDALPSVGAIVTLPTDRQLRAIVESGERGFVKIGSSPLGADADVRVDPDRMFGRHLAVLGNTGSGKSCSVAGLIRWSIEAATRETSEPPNARFIVLDPNGEYSRAFAQSDHGLNARVFSVDASERALPLRVPLWLWNTAEWCAFTKASTKTQRPALIEALRMVRSGQVAPVGSRSHEMRKYLRTLVTIIRQEQLSGNPWGRFPKNKSFYEKLDKWRLSLAPDRYSFHGEEQQKLSELVLTLEDVCRLRHERNPGYDFTRQEVERVLDATRAAHSAFGGELWEEHPTHVDAPLPFDSESLIRAVEASGEMLNVAEHVEPLLLRIRTLLADKKLQPIIRGSGRPDFEEWLGMYLGSNLSRDDPSVSIIDLSLVPTDTVHVITAVIARLIFDALQRFVKVNGFSLPTVLVIEEAHTFIKRYHDGIDDTDVALVCCQVFERIAREGRKFGLGLVLSSQRPSDLSPTVLSQCNTFLLHRISNDRDQDILRRLVPDNLRGLFRELPSLSTQTAILLGWATELPVLVRITDLPINQQPRSEDPRFWEAWTSSPEGIDWANVVQDWTDAEDEEPF